MPSWFKTTCEDYVRQNNRQIFCCKRCLFIWKTQRDWEMCGWFIQSYFSFYDACEREMRLYSWKLYATLVLAEDCCGCARRTLNASKVYLCRIGRCFQPQTIDALTHSQRTTGRKSTRNIWVGLSYRPPVQICFLNKPCSFNRYLTNFQKRNNIKSCSWTTDHCT